jgi:hypothetical protein
MKLFTLSIAFLCFGFIGFSQATKPANVYPSNLEENMYFKAYDANQHAITGLHFLVLSDGNNSKDKTPAFEVTIYLMPVGKSSIDDLIVVKKYQLAGIFHMGSHEFKNETISLVGIDIPPGDYRLGIWVNSGASFEEDQSDNATLFNNSFKITNARPANNNTNTNETPTNNNPWGSWGEEEEDEDDE